MTKHQRQRKILYEGDPKKNLNELKSKNNCTLGDDGAWCDGLKSSKCAFCIHVGNTKQNACELGI